MLHAQLNDCASQWQCLSLCVPEERDGYYIEKPLAVSVPVAASPVKITEKPITEEPETQNEMSGAEALVMSGAEALVEKVARLSIAVQSVGSVFYEMRLMWPLSFFSSIGAAMIVPLFPYIATNFFARQYTDLSPEDIHCESTPDMPYCVKANAESVNYQCMTSTASAMLQVLVGPFFGAVSDSWGRKKVICIICFMQVLAALSFYLNMHGLLSFWVVLVFYPLFGLPFLSTYFTMAIDMIRNPDGRSIAFNLIVVVDAACILLGLVVSSILDLQHVVTCTFACFAILLLYTFTMISETLRPDKRTPFNCWSAIPGMSLMVFFQDRLHRQLGLTFFIGLLYRTGYLAIAPGYLQKYLAFTQTQTCIWYISTQLSAIATMASLMGPVQQWLGDAWTMCISLTASICVCFIMPRLSTANQMLIMCFLLSGLTQFLLPVVSGVVTKITKERDQGMMQGALTAWQGLASAIGPLVMNALYQVSSQLAAADRANAQAMPWYCLGVIVTPAAATAVFANKALRAASQAHELSLLHDGENLRRSSLVSLSGADTRSDLDSCVAASALRRQRVGERM